MLANKKRSVFLALEAERFFLGVTVASSLFVASAFFRAAAPGVPVAVFYFLIAVLTLVTLFKVEYIIRLWGRIAVLFTLTTIAAAASFALVFVPPSSFGALLLMGVLLMAASLPVLLDMISESFTFDKAAGRSYGLQWSSYYLGFIPATFLSTYLLQNYGFSGLFFILGLLYAAMLFPAVILSRLTGRLNHFGSRKITLRAFLGGGWFAGIYFVAVALQFFYAIMAVYMPLYLRENGYSWEEIGLMFTIMLLPFLLVEYWAGAAADRWWGERELLAVGAGLIVLSMFWIVSAPPQMTLVWAAVLFVSRVGAALVEIMSDTYFFKHIRDEDLTMIDIYRAAAPVGYLTAMTVAFFAGLSGQETKVFMFAATVVVFVLVLPVIFALRDTPALDDKKR